MKSLEELMKELPPDLQKEVRDFAQFLVGTKVRPKRKYLRMDWAGGLREYRDQFTSLQLQKKLWSGGATDVFGGQHYLEGGLALCHLLRTGSKTCLLT